MHAPASDVVHRWLTNQLRKARGKCRARHSDLARQRLDRPWPRRFSMDESNGVADLLVLKRTEPSGLGGWIARNPGSDGLDDQDVCEPRDHGLSARTQLSGLARHQSQRALDPLRLGRAPGVEG